MSIPRIRLVCWIRSVMSVCRSRDSRRRSSSSGLGGTTIEQTRGSPRFQAISVRSSVSPSIRSLLALRLRRGTATEAGSTTWLSTPFFSSIRCNEKPSRPASWIATILTGWPIRTSAFSFANRSLRIRRSSGGMHSASCIAVAVPLTSYGLTMSASSRNSSAAPASRDNTTATPSRESTGPSLATRFMPSRRGLTTSTSAICNAASERA